MRAMGRSTEEVEVKLAFPTAHEALSALKTAGAHLVLSRHFEDNAVWDRDVDPLLEAGCLLRLRRARGVVLLTFKAPLPVTDPRAVAAHRHKVREEHETEVADPDALQRVLRHLGFHTVYRYQKYRTELAHGALRIALDETPLGCFVELEGEGDDIDHFAAALGFTPADYIRASYRELHQARAGARSPSAALGDLLMPVDAPPDETARSR